MTASVEELLQKNSIKYQKSGRRFLIKCLNPEHEDNNPSLSLDSVTGLGKCFACNFRVNIFAHFGESYNFQNFKAMLLQGKLDTLKSNLTGLEFPSDYVPETRDFRGISSKTLQRFEAFNSTLEEWRDRLVFPLRDTSGKIRCFIGRHKHSDVQPKYKILPHKVEVPLFPSVVKPYKGTVLLVEGIFDALNLIDKGLDNVVCVFGTSTITPKRKDKLLPLKFMGVSKIVVLFDGDTAGRKATTEVIQVINSLDFASDSIELPEGVDPGDLSQEDVNKLKGML